MMKLVWGLMFALAAGAPAALMATDYFVCSERGVDAHDGLAPETAWRTVGRVNAAELKPGDVVRFRRGGVWRGALRPKSGATDRPVTYTAFGEGAKPSLFGSVPLRGCWQAAGEGLWQTEDALCGWLDVDVGNLVFNGEAAGWKRWSRAELRQQGDFFYDAEAKRVVLFSERPPDESYVSVEGALKRHLVDLSGRSWCVFEGLDFRYGAAHGFGGSRTAHVVIRDCDLSWIGGGHQFTRPDGTPVRYGNAVEFWSDARDHLVESNRIWEVYDAALTNQGDGTNVQKNIMFRGNVVSRCEYSYEYWNRGEMSVTENVVVEGNVFRDAGYGWGHRQRPDPNGRHVMIYDNPARTSGMRIVGNLFSRATESVARICATRGQEAPDHKGDGTLAWTRELTLDRNRYEQVEGGAVIVWGTTAYGLEAFCGATGKEKDGLFAVVP